MAGRSEVSQLSALHHLPALTNGPRSEEVFIYHPIQHFCSCRNAVAAGGRRGNFRTCDAARYHTVGSHAYNLRNCRSRGRDRTSSFIKSVIPGRSHRCAGWPSFRRCHDTIKYRPSPIRRPTAQKAKSSSRSNLEGEVDCAVSCQVVSHHLWSQRTGEQIRDFLRTRRKQWKDNEHHDT